MSKSLHILIQLSTIAFCLLGGTRVFGQTPSTTITPPTTGQKEEATSSEEPKRLPVPSDDVRQKTLETVREIYKNEIQAARTPREMQALAEKVLQKGRLMTDDPEGRFALLSLAQDIAAQAGDGETAFQAAENLARFYAEDVLELKAEALSKLFKAPQDITEPKALIERARRLMEQAATQERYKLARQVGGQAAAEARKMADRDLLQSIVKQMSDINRQAAAHTKFQKGRETLAKNPDDEEANSAVGRYLCLVRGDWEHGLPHLAKGCEGKLKTLAQTEMTNPPSDPEGQVKLADAWWDLAQAERGGESKSLQLHAGDWYRQAIDKLPDNLLKTKVNKRLSEVAEHLNAAVAQSGRERAAQPTKLEKALRKGLDLGGGVKMEFVLIPAGSFLMGDEYGKSDEKPMHKVTITQPFYMGKYEVTQEQWQAIMGNNPSHFKGPRNPVENVSWEDCQVFLKKLNEKVRRAGLKFSLPTEAQWEYACRAGTRTRFSFGNSRDDIGNYAWFKDNSDNKTHPVGMKKPNQWGLYDMPGNVWEMCADWYDAKNHEQLAPNVVDPLGPRFGVDHVRRGGSFSNNALDCASSNRIMISPRFPFRDIGFRVVVY